MNGAEKRWLGNKVSNAASVSGVDDSYDYGFIPSEPKRKCINCITVLRKGNAGPWCHSCERRYAVEHPLPIDTSKPLYVRLARENKAAVDTLMEKWNAEA